MPNKIPDLRRDAFSRQSGRCYYCGLPMWTENPEEFASNNHATLGQVKRFRCTAEHLKARQDGGTDAPSNIVAACLFCNQTRHKRKHPLSPGRYKRLVMQRMGRRRWHESWVF